MRGPTGALDLSVYGFGFVPGRRAEVGSAVACLVSIVIPLSIAVGMTCLLRRLRLSGAWQAGLGIAAGTAAMVVQPYLMLALVCGFTGDCL